MIRGYVIYATRNGLLIREGWEVGTKYRMSPALFIELSVSTNAAWPKEKEWLGPLMIYLGLKLITVHR